MSLTEIRTVPSLLSRFEEYPKLQELIRLKDELVGRTAHPPCYLKWLLQPYDALQQEFVCTHVVIETWMLSGVTWKPLTWSSWIASLTQSSLSLLWRNIAGRCLIFSRSWYHIGYFWTGPMGWHRPSFGIGIRSWLWTSERLVRVLFTLIVSFPPPGVCCAKLRLSLVWLQWWSWSRQALSSKLGIQEVELYL